MVVQLVGLLQLVVFLACKLPAGAPVEAGAASRYDS
jgi:hypothetical protein